MTNLSGEWLPANPEFDPTQVTVGMRVFGSDDLELGRVKEVREHDFLLDRPVQRDVYVPLSAIRQVEINVQRLNLGAEVLLDVTSNGLDEMGWSHV